MASKDTLRVKEACGEKINVHKITHRSERKTVVKRLSFVTLNPAACTLRMED